MFDIENNEIKWDSIFNFIQNANSEYSSNSKLNELENNCREMNLPIVRKDTANFLQLICTIINPKKILEIGCCVGYSAILMCESSPNLLSLTTIDRYDYMIDRARINIKDFMLENKITLLEGQASEILPELKDKYDLIFLDAAKGQYPEFFPYCEKLLNIGGIFIADNILFDGLLADNGTANHRDKTIIKRMNDFIEMVKNQKNFKSTVLPIGDGLTISYKISD